MKEIIMDIFVYLWVLGIAILAIAYLTSEIRNDEEDYDI